jgi:hypothetical protein
LLLVPIATFASAEHARIGFRAALAGRADAIGEGTSLLARGLTAPLNTIPFGLGVLWLPSLLLGSAACAALAHAAWNRRAVQTGSLPLPVAGTLAVALLWAGCGAYGAVLSAIRYCAALLIALGEASSLPYGDKVPHLLAVSAAARVAFERGYIAALLVIGAITAAAAVAVWRKRARAAELAVSARRDVLAGVGCLAAAAALLALAAPYRAENLHPIQVDAAHHAWSEPFSHPRVRLPLLSAPDSFEPSPVLELDTGHVWLDGRAVDTTALAEDLATARRNWAVLHSREPFTGALAVLCDASTSTARLRGALLTAHAAGYASLRLGLDDFHEYQRPLLGKLKRGRLAAARVTSRANAQLPGAPAAELELSRYRTCDALSRGVAALRTARRDVVLQL